MEPWRTIIAMDEQRSGSRRGRPRAADVAARRIAALEAAEAELIESGWAGFTVAVVAARARCSKESLYAWFGDRDGLVRELIRRQADRAVAALGGPLEHPAEPRVTLEAWGLALLRLLTGPVSVKLNRAAMTNPTLAQTLREEGRYRAGPAVEDYIDSLIEQGFLRRTTSAHAFGVLYGLLVQDLQIGVLLGAAPPPPGWLRARAAAGVDSFLRLHQVEKR